ncbi:Mur ligase family protein [Williamsia deligens]|uniref:UDP-N-acetylmuramyl-tripeptide synthetase n=1 Tax=Williamsia deligens TaxID=321325 RepID=A0ABW3G5Y2_9NOCA|nr:UDP-N-acetylmuramoyl-L-alanyl-D-glutamate--2,6-diaminopimelate ligase [Williamsia deligens]
MPTPADVAAFLGTAITGGPIERRRPLRDVVDDSRTLGPGDVYMAFPGTHRHGLDFEDDARRAGVALVVSDRAAAHLPTVVVDDPRAVAGPLAAWFHGHPSREMRVHGVTGTNGKSSTAAMVHAGLLGADGRPGLLSGVEITGPGITTTPVRTTPEAAVVHRTLAHFARTGCDSVALEVSSHAAVHRRVDGVAFASMTLTNLSPEHLDFHGTMEAYFRAKASLFAQDRTERAVVSVDDDHGRRLARAVRVPVVTHSVTDPGADVYASEVRAPDADADHRGHRFTVHTAGGEAEIRLQVLGPHQVADAVAAVAVLTADDLPVDAAAEGISALRTISGRCEPVSVGQPFTALVDYMHNVAGQLATLPFLRSRTPGRLVVVIGATGDRDPAKRRPIGATAAAWADLVVVTDESPGTEDPAAIRAEVRAGAEAAGHVQVLEVPDRDSALRTAVSGLRRGDTVVVAGRGSDRRQVFGDKVIHFDDHARLVIAVEDECSAPAIGTIQIGCARRT